MNIAQLSEQLKDVPQNRLIDYAKNPNSVVPQFLALAEIQRRQQLSAQAQPPQSTVANDVLSQAAPQVDPSLLRAQAMQRAQPQQPAQQLPENQPGVAQLPTGMGQGFASGGIVAFADGGLNLDDDSEDDREMAQLFPTAKLASFQDALAGIRGLMDKLPKSYEATKAAQETAATPRGSHKYEQAVLDEAKRQGVDPNLALHVLYKETGNLKDPESARSKAGALGVMQLMPATAKSLGVNPMDPIENIRGGISYLKQMYNKYNDPRLAAAAYNAGPGNVDKALKRSGGLDTLSHETRNYIAGLAAGGDVKKYAGKNDSFVKGDEPSTPSYVGYGEELPYDPNSNWNITQNIKDWWNRNTPGTKEFVTSSQAPAAKTPDAVNFGIKDPGTWDDTAPRAYQTKEQMGPPADYSGIKSLNAPDVTEVTPPSQAELYAQELRQSIKEQAANLAKQGDINSALALMQAGFGMMASKSPYFLQGVGAGGEAGIGTLAALNKQQSDQAKDLMAARLGLYKVGAAEEAAKETREYNKLFRESESGRKTTEANERAEDRAYLRYGTRLKEIENEILKGYQNNPMYNLNPEKFAAEIQAKIAAAKASDELLNALRQRAGLGAAPAQASTGVVKQYNPKTGKVE